MFITYSDQSLKVKNAFQVCEKRKRDERNNWKFQVIYYEHICQETNERWISHDIVPLMFIDSFIFFSVFELFFFNSSITNQTSIILFLLLFIFRLLYINVLIRSIFSIICSFNWQVSRFILRKENRSRVKRGRERERNDIVSVDEW